MVERKQRHGGLPSADPASVAVTEICMRGFDEDMFEVETPRDVTNMFKMVLSPKQLATGHHCTPAKVGDFKIPYDVNSCVVFSPMAENSAFLNNWESSSGSGSHHHALGTGRRQQQQQQHQCGNNNGSVESPHITDALFAAMEGTGSSIHNNTVAFFTPKSPNALFSSNFFNELGLDNERVTLVSPQQPEAISPSTPVVLKRRGDGRKDEFDVYLPPCYTPALVETIYKSFTAQELTMFPFPPVGDDATGSGGDRRNNHVDHPAEAQAHAGDDVQWTQNDKHNNNRTSVAARPVKRQSDIISSYHDDSSCTGSVVGDGLHATVVAPADAYLEIYRSAGDEARQNAQGASSDGFADDSSLDGRQRMVNDDVHAGTRRKEEAAKRARPPHNDDAWPPSCHMASSGRQGTEDNVMPPMEATGGAKSQSQADPFPPSPVEEESVLPGGRERVRRHVGYTPSKRDQQPPPPTVTRRASDEMETTAQHDDAGTRLSPQAASESRKLSKVTEMRNRFKEVRQMHNDIEKQRRCDMQTRFRNLRDAIPLLLSDKKASKVQILKVAQTYVRQLEDEFVRLDELKLVERERNRLLLDRLCSLTNVVSK